MAEKDPNEMSIDEILSSIRKYVAIDPPHPESSKKQEEDPPFSPQSSPSKKALAEDSDLDVIRLNPLSEAVASSQKSTVLEDINSKLKSLEDIKMPDFFQKVPKNLEDEPESSIFENPAVLSEALPQKITTPQPSSPALDLAISELVKQASMKSLTAFRNQASSMISESNSHSDILPQGNSLDKLVQNAIRAAVSEWINKNLPSMIEKLVEREIHKLTVSLFSPAN